MTIQGFLNDLNSDICICCLTRIDFCMLVLTIILIIIAFSLYGWLCATQVIQNNLGFCYESFTIALASEIMIVVFFIIPLIVGCLLNCIYPLKSQSKKLPVSATSPRIPKSRRASRTYESEDASGPLYVSVSPYIAGSPKQLNIKVPNSPKTSIPNHAYTSFNKLHTIQEKRKSKSPTRRLSV